MRMWMCDPSILCRKHLLGEHLEIHKFRHVFVKSYSIAGRKGQIEPISMGIRHSELVEEMIRRGYTHNSSYIQPDLSYYDLTEFIVDKEKSLKDLFLRCNDCYQNFLKISLDCTPMT